MSSESVIQRQIWTELGKTSALFRINTGKGYVSGGGKPGRLRDGSMLIPAARPVALGLGMLNGDPKVGASDLQGWTPVVITQEMVGSTVAVYTAIETKRSKGGKASQDQLQFIDQLKRDGGIAGVASSVEQAKDIINNWLANTR